MTQANPDCLTDGHLLLFGKIIQCFARHETLLEEIMAAASGADATSIKLLTMDLNFGQKRHALLNLLRHRALPIDQVDKIQGFLRVPHTFAGLRNDIAHSTWVQGDSPSLIHPAWLTHGPLVAIRAMHDIGEHKGDFVGNYDDQVTYTIENLQAILKTLEENYRGAREYAAGVGLAA
jgi:hypothetical protein